MKDLKIATNSDNSKLVFDGLQIDPKKEKAVVDHIKLIDMCMVAIENNENDSDDVPVFLPSTEFLDTKQNKVYLIPKDTTTPQGVVVRGNVNALKFKPHACIRYNAYDLMSWLVVLTNDMEEQGEKTESSAND